MTPSIQGGWEHVQRGTKEVQMSTSWRRGVGGEGQGALGGGELGGGGQCELGGLLFAVLILATFRGHSVFLSAYHSFPSFWKDHSGFPLRNCPASTPSPWHPGRMTLPCQSQIQEWAQAPAQAIVLSMACFRDGLTWKLGPSVSALGL